MYRHKEASNGGLVAVQDHVHSCQGPGGIIHSLTVDGDAVRQLAHERNKRIGGTDDLRLRHDLALSS